MERTCYVFDLDGTLVDSRQAVYMAYLEAGVKMPDWAWGKPWDAWCATVCKDQDEANIVHAVKNEIYPEMLEKYGVWLPMRDLAYDLHRDNRPVFVITGASHDAAVLALKFLEVPIALLWRSGLTVEQKNLVLVETMQLGFTQGIYFDDKPGVSVPDMWEHWIVSSSKMYKRV